MKNRVAFHTLGCRVNSYETESMKEQFKKKGYSIVPFDEVADVYVVNTCTVTSIADKKNRNILRRAKRANSNSIVVATGCYAQTNYRDLERMEEVDLVVGQKEKDIISTLVDDFHLYRDKRSSFVGNVFKYETYSEMDFAGLREIDKAYVKIQDGCDRFCSFCKIPFARGKKRSRNLQSIVKECRMLIEEGYREIVLIGIHLGAYGEDLTESCSLDDVVESVLNLDGLERLRLSSLYPETISDRFIDLMHHPKLMPHLHLSIQSADDKVLGLMKRRYDSSLMYKVFNKIREQVGDVAFTGDVIVGFPGEEEENFLNTYNFIKEFEFSDLHIFPYSDRERTEASSFKNKVNDYDKRDRFNRLNLLRSTLQEGVLSRYLGREIDLLIESSKDSVARGYTPHFFKGVVDITAKPGEIVTFVPERVQSGVLYGSKVKR